MYEPDSPTIDPSAQTDDWPLPGDPTILFLPMGTDVAMLERIDRESLSFWQDSWRRLRKNKLALTGGVFVILFTLIAIFGPMLTRYNPNTQQLRLTNQGPSATHWFGTDQFGRDLFTRVVYGIRISLIVAYVSTVFSVAIGVTYGTVSAVLGGQIDNVMMRIVDIMMGIPSLLYLILLIVVLGPGLWSIIAAFALTGWLGMARMVRAEVLSLKNREFVLASRALGTRMRTIAARHLVPNALGTIIVLATLSIPGAIFAEAFLSYIGLGITAPQASLGVLASDASDTFMTFPHQLLFPALAISLIILFFNFLGDGLRDALDPKMKK